MNMREYVLCVDLGGTKTYIAKGREDGEIEDIRRFTIDFSNQATVLRQLFSLLTCIYWKIAAGIMPRDA